MVEAAGKPRFVVVGGGLAGLMTTLKLAEAGLDVDLFSVVPVKRSHSVCAQGGINGAVNTKGEGDHPDKHTFELIRIPAGADCAYVVEHRCSLFGR